MKKFYSIFSALAVFFTLSCTPENIVDTGVSDVTNPMEGKSVYYKGETIIIRFKAEADWTADLEFKQGEDWAQITEATREGKAGKGSVNLNIDQNETGEERSVLLWVRVKGKTDNMSFEFKQAAKPESSAMSEVLNKNMDEILEEKYLWAEQYRTLDRDLTVSYSDFLYTHLAKLGETNIEDGGYYRAFSSNSGTRYIYSYIQEVVETKAMTRSGTLTNAYGLGIGPLFASPTGVEDNIYLTVGYVYRGSPAEAAGLQKGDNIYAVAKGNGRAETITRENYQQYMKELFSSPSGTYTLMFARYDPPTEEEPGVYNLNTDHYAVITTASYGYDPVLFAAILKKDNLSSSENLPDDLCVGYLALESFDMNAQFILEDQMRQFDEAGINELILDFSFCVGGVVDQACYLASSIVGEQHYNDIFFSAKFQYRENEDWTFVGNNPNLPDGQRLGVGPDFGLKRVWIIVSENTASAAELIINALQSQTINFPVTLIGSRTEGKNVGMEVSYITYGSRTFEFAPITYWGLNADGDKGPADGFIPEGENLLNNQNSSYSDDRVNIFPYTFGDWGNFDFNRPFYYIFCDIIDQPRPEDKFDTTPTKSVSGPAQIACEPIAFTGVKHEPGRYGTLIYR